MNGSKLLLFSKPWAKRGTFYVSTFDKSTKKIVVRKCDDRILINEFFREMPKAILDKYDLIEQFTKSLHPVVCWRSQICALIPEYAILFDYLNGSGDTLKSLFNSTIYDALNNSEGNSDNLARIRSLLPLLPIL